MSRALPILPVFPSEDKVLLIGCLLGALIPYAWRRMRKKSMATWGFPVQVAAFGIAKALLAANIAFIVQDIFPYRYRSTATMFVQNGSPEQIQAITTDATSRTSLSAIINDPRLSLYKEQRKTQPLEDVIENMQQNLAITPSGQYFTISFEYPDRFKTQQTVHAVMNRLDEAYERTYGTLPDEPVHAAPTTLKVLDGPSMPVLPISPNRYVIALKGGLAGLLAAAVMATAIQKTLETGGRTADGCGERIDRKRPGRDSLTPPATDKKRVGPTPISPTPGSKVSRSRPCSNVPKDRRPSDPSAESEKPPQKRPFNPGDSSKSPVLFHRTTPG